MPKRILVTSTDLMMIQFLVPHVINLVEHGYQIEIACSNVGDRIDDVHDALFNYVSNIHVVNLHRNPAHIENLNGFRKMIKIIDSGYFDLIWTNEPVMGVVTRLAARSARKHGTKVLYMVHGFHFFEGAPILNWLAFYPIERFMASATDVICTINREDYLRAKSFQVERSEYIHGIGVDTDRLKINQNNFHVREELNLPDDSFLILSVGELNKNKNHATIIEAISKIDNPNVHYLLCGKGNQRRSLEQLTVSKGLDDRVHFLGYRNDILTICSQVDIFVLPTIREGLGLAALEAMYAGLPLVTSITRGSKDYMQGQERQFMYEYTDTNGFTRGIITLIEDEDLRRNIAKENARIVIPFTLENVKNEVLQLIDSMFEGKHINA